MNKPKDKGRRAEHLVVSKLKELGIKAERVPLSGSLGGKYKHDIAIPSIADRRLSIEVKNQESISTKLWTWKEGVEILVIKKNNYPLLAIVDWDVLSKWIHDQTD